MARTAAIDRAPAGTPRGGQFVATQHAEADVELSPGQMDIWDCIAEVERDRAADLFTGRAELGERLTDYLDTLAPAPTDCPYAPEIGYDELLFLNRDYDPTFDYYKSTPEQRAAMRFRYVHRFPVEHVSGPTEPEDYVSEMEYDDDDEAEAEADIQLYSEIADALEDDQDAADPVLIDPSKVAPLFDGNHRSGLALSRGVTHLPAYVRVR